MTHEQDVGQTRIDPDEAGGLLLAIRTQAALNEAEAANILRARTWALRSRLVRHGLLRDVTLRRIHREMFGGVWRWAGKYRTSGKNIGVPWHDISIQVRQLADNFAFRITQPIDNRDAFAVEFHYRLVVIHAFPNGNGRHARFCADRLIELLGGRAFRWGRSDLQDGTVRDAYLTALREADRGAFDPIVKFARSGEDRTP